MRAALATYMLCRLSARSLALLALASLLAGTSASADRRRRDRDDRDDDRADDRTEDRRRLARRQADRREREGGDDREEREDRDGAEAEATFSIKLDDLIDTAVRLAPELARSKADRAVARGTAGAIRRAQSWVLGGEASYSIFSLSEEADIQPFGTVREDTTKVGLSLGRNLPTGGNVGIELGLTRIGREILIPQEYIDAVLGGMQEDNQDEFTTTHQASAMLRLTQPIARGVGADVALAEQNKADLAASEATLVTQLTAEKMVFNLVAAYWELAFLANQVEVRNESLDLAEGQEKMTREQIRAGVVQTTALNAVTYELKSRRAAVLEAEIEFEKKSLELRRQAGLELGQRQIALRPQDAFEIGKDEWDIDDVLARSRKANRRMLQLAIQRKAADIDVKVAKNGMLPKLDLNLSGGIIGNGASLDNAFSGVTALNGYQVTAGLTVQFELSGAAKAAHEAAQAKKARIEVDRVDAQRQLDVEVVSAAKMVTAARERVGLSDAAIVAAEGNVDAERQSFAAQRSDNFRVMERQTQLVDARLRRGRAVVDYHIAVAQLQYLSGMLLEQYGVAVRPRD